MSEDIFFLFLVLQQTNLFVGWSSKNKKVDLSTSCVVQFLQGPPRRAERKGVKRSEQSERSSQSVNSHKIKTTSQSSFFLCPLTNLPSLTAIIIKIAIISQFLAVLCKTYKYFYIFAYAILKHTFNPWEIKQNDSISFDESSVRNL